MTENDYRKQVRVLADFCYSLPETEKQDFIATARIMVSQGGSCQAPCNIECSRCYMGDTTCKPLKLANPCNVLTMNGLKEKVRLQRKVELTEYFLYLMDVEARLPF
jgi:hypothetical protein